MLNIRRTIKTCTLALVLGAGLPLSAYADEGNMKWYLQTDHGYCVQMDSVQYLASADDDQFFSVVILDGVISLCQKVTFVQKELPASGIVTIKSSENYSKPQAMLVHNTLHLSGLKDAQQAQVFTADGRLVFRTALSAGSSDIDVNGLANGNYILRVEKTSLKFIKR